MKLDDDTWQRWQGRCKVIKDDLSGDVGDNSTARHFRQMVQDNQAWIKQHQGLPFCSFVLRSDVTRAALGVRRHVKNDKKAVSLVRLMSQMATCAHAITVEFYLQHFPAGAEGIEWQEASFQTLSADGTKVSAQIIDADLAGLKQLAATIEGFADRKLAHLDKRGFDGRFAWRDLDACIDDFNSVACKYLCFLTGTARTSLAPVLQYDQERIFKMPLIKPSIGG